MFNILCATDFGASLQSVLTTITSLQSVEQTLTDFGERFDELLQGVETQLLTLIYPESAAAVQAQVDACEIQFWSTQEAEVEDMAGSLYLLSTACASQDPDLPVNQLIQNILTLLTTVAEGCDTLSVNLAEDTNNLIATAIQQGYEFTGECRSLTELAAESAKPLVASWNRFNQIHNALEDVLMRLGTTRKDLDASVTDAEAIQIALINATNEIAATGVPSVEDLVDILEGTERLLSDGITDISEALQGITTLFIPVVQSSCLFFRPIMEIVEPNNR